MTHRDWRGDWRCRRAEGARWRDAVARASKPNPWGLLLSGKCVVSGCLVRVGHKSYCIPAGLYNSRLCRPTRDSVSSSVGSLVAGHSRQWASTSREQTTVLGISESFFFLSLMAWVLPRVAENPDHAARSCGPSARPQGARVFRDAAVGPSSTYTVHGDVPCHCGHSCTKNRYAAAGGCINTPSPYSATLHRRGQPVVKPRWSVEAAAAVGGSGVAAGATWGGTGRGGGVRRHTASCGQR